MEEDSSGYKPGVDGFQEDSGRHLPGGIGDGERREKDTSLVLMAFQEDSRIYLPDIGGDDVNGFLKEIMHKTIADGRNFKRRVTLKFPK